MGLLSLAKPQDGKYIRAYWQKTKNDKNIGGLVSDGEKKQIRCSYTQNINEEALGDIGLVTDGKTLEIITNYDIRINDWIYIHDIRYAVAQIIEKKPQQESNMFMKESVVNVWKVLVK